MIIEEDAVAMETLTAILEGKYDVFKINNPVDCLKTLAATKPKIDLAIVDIEMPHINGFKLIPLIKKHPLYAKVPFIILTSRTGKEYINKAILAGASDYIVNPVDKETLLQKVHKQLGDEEKQKEPEDPLAQWEFPE